MAITDGLLAYWNFDGTADDVSGNGNGLVLIGDATFDQGLFGQGLSLDGNGLAQEVDANPTFAFESGDFTVQIWAEFNFFSGEQTLIEKFTGAGGPGWTFTMPVNLQFYSYPGPVLNGGGAPSTGTWHEFIIERAGSEFNMFYDGSLVATYGPYSGDLPVSSNPLLIGARTDGDGGQGFRLNGTVDDVAIWGRALSASEIAALWNDGAGQPVGSATIPNNAAPAITSNGGGETAAISIMENTSAVTTVEATDPDAAQALSYSISGGADAFWFAIDPTSGALSFKTAPDFENPTDADPDNVYNVTVQVSDGNGGTDTQAVAVTVQNVAGSTINGTNKVNTLTGSGEEDFLYGKGGNDNLQGLGGNDYLDGGSGKDTMNGGAGADRFVFSAFADSTIANFDIVQGFVHGIDMIDIAGIDANASKKGDQAFVFAGQNSSAIANSATWYESGGNTFVQADVNGNTTADLLIQLTGTNLGLSASDFLL
ncbi:Ca2+-binding RTX toxin-like protein [Bradyrhizobium diazoefficiens]|uniref:LamG-like jellyroll fold domain-containing protein n=1 Tax=Bradyrhizobium TaxID=374 RepID=UPI001B8CA3A3|nr:LamG-like jellyroll fold domain-containing protein [Bradyrhizobium diazoefficiens]MBR0867773.1 cadherin domain-containing protein [Bradyrhizobium diazoefficiens]MBR0892706.1 cadherin domain-containing protein [Bradyrhizobium diazoefficiens]MBR0924665.1 cadherin domain-containing protein [Bradyrhizobium diazoefficiens]